jgi:hypothetical protein
MSVRDDGITLFDKMLETWCKSLGFTTTEFAELAQAKAEGRLIVLPCKVGDKIYTIPDYAYSGFKYWEVFSIEIFSGDIIFRLGHSGTTDYNSFALSDWGMRAFSSKEAAEAALKQMGGKE